LKRQNEEEKSERQRTLQRESALNQRAYHFKRREELQQKIRELGSLPTDAFERYRNAAKTQVPEGNF